MVCAVCLIACAATLPSTSLSNVFGMPKGLKLSASGPIFALGIQTLGGPDPWHICIRSDRHGQNIYGPSLATTEVVLHYPMRRPRHIVALGLTKAMHEFLTLHYFAIDSAAGWDELLERRLPAATWMKADARRLMAIEMFEQSHSHCSFA